MKNFSNPMISFQANQLLSNDTLNRNELFVKLPENKIQNEVAILWKDLQILSVELYEEKSKKCCFKKRFETAVSIHTIVGLDKGSYLAKLRLKNGDIQYRILILL